MTSFIPYDDGKHITVFAITKDDADKEQIMGGGGEVALTTFPYDWQKMLLILKANGGNT